jgi:hypothetical protein
MLENLGKLFAFIWHQVIPRLVSLVLRHPYAVPSTLCLLVASGVMASRYAEMATLQESLLEEALNTRTYSTSDGIKGPEALWTASAPNCIKDDLEKDEISQDFRNQFRTLKVTIETLAATCKFGCADKLDTKTLTLLGEGNNQVLTDDDKSSFLFFPTRLSPAPALLSTVVQKQDKTLPEPLRDVGNAIYVSQQIGSGLTSMLNIPIFGNGPTGAITSPQGSSGCTGGQHRRYLNAIPVQVYYIDDHGLNRIVGRYDGKNISKEYYERQFSAATNFATRPYYLPALQQAQDEITSASGPIGNYFYVTDPYFDIAGNGMVVTRARGFSYPGLGRGVLCFDLGLVKAPGAKQVIPLDTINRLGSIARVAHCTIPFTSSGSPVCNLDAGDFKDEPAFRRSDETLPDALKNELEETLNKQRQKDALSEVTGSVMVLDRLPAFESVSQPQGIRSIFIAVQNAVLDQLSFPGLNALPSTGWQLLISAPLGLPNVGEQQEKADMVVFNVNMPAFRRRTVLWGLGGLSALLLSLGIGGFVLELDSRMSREMYKALVRVSRIMAHSGLPFTWLDTDDTILQASDAFIKTLGFDSLKDLFAAHPTKKFEDLLDPNSISVYRDVEERRKRGLPVTPYHVSFVRKDKTLKDFTIVSASVPSSKGFWSSVPATFGVLLEGEVEISDQIN